MVHFSSLIVLNLYFKDKLSLATGFCYTGAGLGQLSLPHLLNWLLTMFDTRSAMLIMGACMLNMLVGTAVYRPLSYYTGIEFTNRVRTTINTASSEEIILENKTATPTNKSGAIENYVATNLAYCENEESHQGTPTINDNDSERAKPLSHCCETTNPHQRVSPIICSDPRDGQSELKLAAINLVKNYQDPAQHATLNNLVKAENKILKTKTPASGPAMKYITMHKLILQPRFLLFIFGKVMITICYMVSLYFLAPFAASDGLQDEQLALLLTLTGGVDLLFRPIHGWIVSFPQVDSSVYVGCNVLMGSIIIGKHNSTFSI